MRAKHIFTKPLLKQPQVMVRLRWLRQNKRGRAMTDLEASANSSFPDLSRIKAVIVDDLAFGREVARSLLVAAGVQNIWVASDVHEGWHLVCNQHPHLLILDWQMQGMPGLKLLEMVRQSPSSPNPFMPVLMLTAYREQQRVLEALGAGTTSYLVKPFTPREFYLKLKFCIEDKRSFEKQGSYFGPKRAGVGRSIHVLD